MWSPRAGAAWTPAPGRGAGSAEAQVDLRDLGRLGLCVEELALHEAEDAREQDRRDRLDRVVVIEHRRVVVLAREADLVLGRRELLLELHDVRARLEVRVVLDDREQRSQRASQRVLG